MNQTPRVYFDISSLIEYVEKIDRYSGIQRVVTKLLVELLKLPDSERYFAAFRLKGGSDELMVLPLREISATVLNDPLMLRSYFFNVPVERGVAEVLSKYRARPARFRFHRLRLDAAGRLGRKKSFLRYGITPVEWKRMRSEKSVQVESALQSATPLRVKVGPEDTLILIDSSWMEKDVAVFRQAKTLGLRIGSLVYDLIPIRMPQATHGGMPGIFRNWLVRSTEFVDFYMTISESAKTDLAAFLDRLGKTTPVTALPLSQNGLEDGLFERAFNKMDAAEIEEEEIARFVCMKESIRSVFNTPFALCVGTIEARKNGWRLALAWKHLVDQGHVDIPRLVFAGRRGWYVDELFNLLTTTGNVYGYVSVIEGPSDEELDYLYRRCEFALLPSLYEGWGLPVGEALSYGKTSVVARGSSLPEVGQNLVEYCDAHSISSIAAAVLALHEEPDRRRKLEARIATAKLRTWGDVAADLLKIVRG